MAGLNNKIGKKIREARNLQKVPASKISEKIGVSESYITRLEKGDRNISLKTLEALSEALNVNIDIKLTPTSTSSDKTTDENEEIVEQVTNLLYYGTEEEKVLIKGLINHLYKSINTNNR